MKFTFFSLSSQVVQVFSIIKSIYQKQMNILTTNITLLLYLVQFHQQLLPVSSQRQIKLSLTSTLGIYQWSPDFRSLNDFHISESGTQFLSTMRSVCFRSDLEHTTLNIGETCKSLIYKVRQSYTETLILSKSTGLLRNTIPKALQQHFQNLWGFIIRSTTPNTDINIGIFCFACYSKMLESTEYILSNSKFKNGQVPMIQSLNSGAFSLRLLQAQKHG